MFKKILIINTFGIGDVLFTTPLVKNIKRAYPDVVCHYLTNRRSASVLDNNPFIERVLIYERDEFQSAYRRSIFEFIKKGKSFISDIRSQRYDAVIDLSLDRGMGCVTAVAGIPRRIGFNYKNRGLFLTTKIAFQGYEHKHVVEYYCDLLQELGIEPVEKTLDLFIPEQDLVWARTWLSEKAWGFSKSLVAVFPGGGASWDKNAVFKRWPVEKYAKLVDKMIEKNNAHIILMGNKNDRELCQEIFRHRASSVHILAGETTLHQSAALLKQCHLAVVNDGGPLHIAVAIGVPTVSIFGPVDDKVYGPYPSRNHIVVKKGLHCQPCYRRFRMASCSHISCLTQLDVEDVFRKVEEVL